MPHSTEFRGNVLKPSRWTCDVNVLLPSFLISFRDLITEGRHMGTAAKPTRENHTITVDFRDEATYFRLMEDDRAFLKCVLAFILSLGFQLTHKATGGGGGGLTRPSHAGRVRLGGATIWRLQGTRGHAVFTVLPHGVWRDRSRRPEVARVALLATPGGLSLARCAVIGHLAPRALSRLVGAFGQQRVVTVRMRCGRPRPTEVLADEPPSRCLTEKVDLPTIVGGRVIWPLG